jgi:hypothetical protein
MPAQRESGEEQKVKSEEGSGKLSPNPMKDNPSTNSEDQLMEQRLSWVLVYYAMKKPENGRELCSLCSVCG